jgi:hypothetical protein
LTRIAASSELADDVRAEIDLRRPAECHRQIDQADEDANDDKGHDRTSLVFDRPVAGVVHAVILSFAHDA